MQNKIPEGWEKVELVEVCSLVTDGTHDKTPLVSKEKGVPLVTSKDLTECGVCFDDVLYITKEQHKQIIKRSKPEKGDLLYSKIGTIGKPTIVDVDFEFSIKNVALFKLKKELIISKYLKLYLSSNEVNSYLNKIAGGGNQKFIPLNQLKKLVIILPPISTQQKIVSILEKVEKAKEMRKEADELTKDFLKAVFMEMFGDEANIQQVELSQATEIIMGQSPPGDSYNENAAGTPFFQGKAEFTERYPVVKKWTTQPSKMAKPNSVLMSVRAPVGSVNVCNIDCCIGRGLASIRPKEKLTLEFLFSALQTMEEKIANLGTGSTFKAITSEQLKTLKIPLPPLSLQQRFASIVKEVEQLKEQQKQSKEQIDNLFNALMQKAFKGELVE